MSDWGKIRLGFGLMRLPKEDNGAEANLSEAPRLNAGDNIDIETSCEMADRFLEAGGTYFDTAYVYAGSEEAFRKSVVERHPRDSYTVADKLAGWILGTKMSPDDMFNESLRRCGVDYFDYYLLHALQPSRYDMYNDLGLWEFAKRIKAEGKARKIGFSFHGDPELLERLLDEHPEMEFVQIQLNYADWESNAIHSRGNYEVLRKYGKDIVIMEPVKGGILANLRPELAKGLEELDPKATHSSFALRFAASLDGVRMVLSGMSSMEQMEDNLKTFTDFKPLSEKERAALADISEKMASGAAVPCTACHYCCDGCPMGINIPDIFKAYNMIASYGEHNRPHFYYGDVLASGSARANECIECGQCEAACPQHINVIERLKDASRALDV